MLGLGLERHGLGTATAAAPDTPTCTHDQPPPPAKKFCCLFAQPTRSAIVIYTHRISQLATAADKVVGFHQQRKVDRPQSLCSLSTSSSFAPVQ